MSNDTQRKDIGKDDGPQYVRITSGGKIKKWVEFSLKFFEENPGRPLVLHTLRTNPSEKNKDAQMSTSQPESSSDLLDEGNVDEDANDETHQAQEPTPNNKQRKPPDSISSQTIPKLVSVVEVIKREYFSKFVKGGEVGLYQYNYLGTIGDGEDWVMEDWVMDAGGVESGISVERKESENSGEDARTQEILSVLSGKNHLKLQKAPYMKIVLCTTPVSQFESNPFYTSQHPQLKKVSKSEKQKRKRENEKDKEKMDVSDDRVDSVTSKRKKAKVKAKMNAKVKGKIQS